MSAPTQCLPGFTAQIRGKPPNITVSCVPVGAGTIPKNPLTDPFSTHQPSPDTSSVAAPKMTHAASPNNKPAAAPPTADTSTPSPSGLDLSFLETNCIPNVPIPCWGLIAGAVIGLIVILKVR